MSEANQPWSDGSAAPPAPNGAYEERLLASFTAKFDALRLDVQRGAQAQCDQMRAEFTAQLQQQGQQLLQQQMEFFRQFGEQQRQMMAAFSQSGPPSPRPALNISTNPFAASEAGPSSGESYDPFSSGAPSTAISSDTSPHSPPSILARRSRSASQSTHPYPSANPFPTFSTLHSLAGTDLLSPTRPQRTSLTDNDFIRTWSLDVHYTYIDSPDGAGGFMCRRCPHLDPATDDGNPNRRRFGLYKAQKDKPASITKRAREHSLRHWREENGMEDRDGEKGRHRRRRSEGDTKRPQIPKPENAFEDEAALSTGAASSREASPSREYRPQHARSSSAPHYDLPPVQPPLHMPPSPSITCVEYEGDSRFHAATLQFDQPLDDGISSSSSQQYLADLLNSTLGNAPDPMDTGSPTAFQFGGNGGGFGSSSEYVDPHDVFMGPDAVEHKPTHDNLFFSYP